MTKKNFKHSTVSSELKGLILDYMMACNNKDYSQAEIIRQEIRKHGTNSNGE